MLEVNLIFVGDMMLDNGPGKAIAAGVDRSRNLPRLRLVADLVVGNSLECVVATCGKRRRRSPGRSAPIPA